MVTALPTHLLSGRVTMVDEIAGLDAQIWECDRAIAALGPPSEKNRSAIAGYLRRRLNFRVRKETLMGRVDEE